jgi:hypothetical protein
MKISRDQVMVVFKKISLLIVIYFLSFIFIREIISNHRQWVPNRLFLNHNQYNHTLSPNFPPDVIHEDDHDIARDYKINSLGLRENDEIILPKPEKEFRILVVGDSFILTNPNLIIQLETNLNKVFSNDQITFNVINCGISSYSALLHLARLKHQLLDLDPDSIIYFPDLTDVYDDTHRYLWLSEFDEKGKLVRVKASTRILRAKRRHKRQINYFLSKIGISNQNLRDVRTSIPGRYNHIFDHAKENINKLSKHTEQELNFTLRFIKDYIEITKSNQIHLSISMYPHLPQIIEENKVYETNMSSLYNRIFEKRVLSLSQIENIVFKSFYEPISQSVLSGNRLYLPNDMHFNDYGFDFLADLVTAWVVRNPQKSIGFAPEK